MDSSAETFRIQCTHSADHELDHQYQKNVEDANKEINRRRKACAAAGNIPDHWESRRRTQGRCVAKSSRSTKSRTPTHSSFQTTRSWVPNGAPSTLMPCSCGGNGDPLHTVVLPGQPFELIARLWTDVAAVPKLWSCLHGCGSCMPEELDSQCRVPDTNPLRPLRHVNVIHESKHFLVWHLGLNCFQSWVLTQREEEWHQWVSLFTTFALVDVVHRATLSLPQVDRRLTVEHPDER